MAKYINAAEAAEKVATAYKIPMGDLVDVFAGIPVADVIERPQWISVEDKLPDTEAEVLAVCNRN